MKRWMIILGVSTLLVVTGCSSNAGDESNDSNESADSGSEEENEIKKDILNWQKNMANTLRPEQSQITNFETMLGDEEADEETVKEAGENAKTAAKDASYKVVDYSVSEDINDEVAEDIKQALPSLQEYYEEI
ncbi:hypothetical protein GCM10010954_05260 [Halobacillus andaensis]|uniref:Lipoprotein n=1 Tax=Halobacillus andaensis TaxID=1176239 RepID=A0A917EV42_HALAA|nr:hypothetical protein [Halobacillus andaensis]MBP2003315.1 hypothetical protein [Halobacillus andaensis]GGF09742.1 hypothetical protein GCM10010954_05260 [Halobacillus andaensis]